LKASVKDSLIKGAILTEANVTFYLVENGTLTPIDGAEDLPVKLFDASDSTSGYAEATVEFKTGTANAANYLIAVGLSGNYSNRTTDAYSYSLVTVSRRMPGGYSAGGGRVNNDSSSGILPGKQLLYTDFQFDARADLFELGSDHLFNPLGSNLPVRINAFQNGCEQKISIEAVNAISQLLFSSFWNGVSTRLTAVDSFSRIYVTGGGVCDADTSIKPEDLPGFANTSNRVNLFVAPNPSNYEFTVIPNSLDINLPIELRVIDQQGRVVEKFINLMPGDPVKFGAAYRSGIYYVQLIQSRNMLSKKLLKL